MKIDGREMPADYKYGTADLGEENLARLQAGELVTIQTTKKGSPGWDVGAIVEVPVAEGQSLWARVVSRQDAVDEYLGPVDEVQIQLAGD